VLGNDPSEIQWLKGRIEQLAKRLTWITLPIVFVIRNYGT